MSPYNGITIKPTTMTYNPLHKCPDSQLLVISAALAGARLVHTWCTSMLAGSFEASINQRVEFTPMSKRHWNFKGLWTGWRLRRYNR